MQVMSVPSRLDAWHNRAETARQMVTLCPSALVSCLHSAHVPRAEQSPADRPTPAEKSLRFRLSRHLQVGQVYTCSASGSEHPRSFQLHHCAAACRQEAEGVREAALATLFQAADKKDVPVDTVYGAMLALEQHFQQTARRAGAAVTLAHALTVQSARPLTCGLGSPLLADLCTALSCVGCIEAERRLLAEPALPSPAHVWCRSAVS